MFPPSFSRESTQEPPPFSPFTELNRPQVPGICCYRDKVNPTINKKKLFRSNENLCLHRSKVKYLNNLGKQYLTTSSNSHYIGTYITRYIGIRKTHSIQVQATHSAQVQNNQYISTSNNKSSTHYQYHIVHRYQYQYIEVFWPQLRNQRLGTKMLILRSYLLIMKNFLTQ